MDFPSKLKAIRTDEKLTQPMFCNELGLSRSSYSKYEAGIIEVGAGPLLKIANHPRFTKYTLWLMTGQDAPECGQVKPTSYVGGVVKEVLSWPEKLNAVRMAERLTLTEMAEVLDLRLVDYKHAEAERSTEINPTVLSKLTTHPRFKKYSLWLMTGETAPEAGQVSPV